jgi:MinD superfamily P-loop ATPase
VKIAVTSGKGGTGKTIVATNLADCLSKSRQVTLIDCDVEEPNCDIFIKPVLSRKETVDIKTPKVIASLCKQCGMCSRICAFNAIVNLPGEVLTFPEMCHSCGACSYFCPTKAIQETSHTIGEIHYGSKSKLNFIKGILRIGEPMATPIIRQIKNNLPRNGVCILDSAPGNTCQVMNTILGCDYCLVVTEPTPFGLNDLKLAINLIRELRVPFGLVINKSRGGDNLITDFCLDQGISILGKLPFEFKISQEYARGKLISKTMPGWSRRFNLLYQSIKKDINRSLATINKMGSKK